MHRICGRRREEVWRKFPLARLVWRRLLPDGNRIYCKWSDYRIIRDVYFDSNYEKHFKPELGMVVVDAGAHVGFFTLKMAKQVGTHGRVIAVEPENENFGFLVTNVTLNGYENVVPAKVALSNFEGVATFFLKSHSSSHSLIGKTWRTPIIDSVTVKVTTLDSLLRKVGVEIVDLLKVNIEGAELNALLGARNFLDHKRIKKIVVMVHPPYDETASKICAYLRGRKYRTLIGNKSKVIYGFA